MGSLECYLAGACAGWVPGYSGLFIQDQFSVLGYSKSIHLAGVMNFHLVSLGEKTVRFDHGCAMK